MKTKSEWKRQSDRDTVKTLLAMGFIPTWLEELLDYGDLIELQANTYTQRALDAEEKLRQIHKIAFDELYPDLLKIIRVREMYE